MTGEGGGQLAREFGPVTAALNLEGLGESTQLHAIRGLAPDDPPPRPIEAPTAQALGAVALEYASMDRLVTFGGRASRGACKDVQAGLREMLLLARSSFSPAPC
jgi:hypothetical protein